MRKRGVEGVGALVNGLHFTLDDARRVGADVPSLAFHLAQRELDAAARAVYAGELSDAVADADPRGAYGWALRGAARKRSAALELVGEDGEPAYVVMKEQTSSSDTRQLADVPVLAYAQRDPSLAAPVTTWVVADAGAEAGANLIAAAYAFAEGTEETVETESSNAAASEESLETVSSKNDPGTRARVAVLHPPETPSSPRARARSRGWRATRRARASRRRRGTCSLRVPTRGVPRRGALLAGSAPRAAAAADALLARQGRSRRPRSARGASGACSDAFGPTNSDTPACWS